MESKFTGGVLGMIGVAFLYVLLTIFTLGFGFPWALCLFINWYVEHTVIDGHKLTFDGHGGQLFGNYIKWILLSIITLGIYSFWVPVNMTRWVTKHTHMTPVAE